MIYYLLYFMRNIIHSNFDLIITIIQADNGVDMPAKAVFRVQVNCKF